MDVWHISALLLLVFFGVVIGTPPNIGTLEVLEPYPVIGNREKDELKIDCIATGDPTPVYSWRKDGKDLKSEGNVEIRGGELRITKLDHKEDSGIYVCLATNSFGTVFKEIKIDVLVLGKFLPPNTATAPVAEFGVTLGKDAILKCPKHSFAKPQIYFWGNLPNNEKPDLIDERSPRRFFTPKGSLVFAYVTQEDVDMINERYGVSCLMYNNGKYEKSRKFKLKKEGEVEQSQKPTLEAFLEKQEVAMKDTEKTLVCGARGKPTPQITWYRDGTEIKQVSRYKTTMPGYRLSGQGVELIISRPRDSNSGKYKCVAKNSLGEDSSEGTLTVEYVPEWKTTIKSASIFYSESHSYNCEAVGTPAPTYEWYKNGNRITSKGNVVVKDNVLQVNNGVLEDSGMYICLARNKHGSITTQANFVVKPVLPSFSTKFPEPYYIFRGRSKELPCEASGGPKPTVEWFRDDKALPAGGRYQIQTDGSLEISNIQFSDKGQYKCTATNVAGSTDLVANVVVIDPTIIVSGPTNSTLKAGSPFQLICDATHDKKYKLEIVWYKDGKVFKGFDDRISLEKRVTGPPHIITIKSLLPSDQGKWSCYAYIQLIGMRSEDWAHGVLKVPGPPDPPNYLRLLEPCHGFETRLSWQLGAENGDYVRYFVVEYSSNYEDDTTSWYVHTAKLEPGTTTKAHLTNLTAYAFLRFRLRAVNSIGSSKPSKPTKASNCETEAGLPLVNPGKVRAIPNEDNKLILKWDPVKRIDQNGPNFEYEVAYRRVGDKSAKFVKTKVRGNTFELPNAGTGVQYEVYVRSVNKKGNGPDPKIYKVYSGQKKPGDAPSNLRVTKLESTSVEVGWDPVTVPKPGNVAGYVLYYWMEPKEQGKSRRKRRASPAASAEKKAVTVGENGPFKAELANLTAAAAYNLVMTAQNSGGEGPGSDVLTFKTKETSPGKPTDVSMTVYGNVLHIQWKPPHDPNGRITSYVIETEPETKKVVLGALDREHFLTGLDPLKFYKVRIRAMNSFGPGATFEREIAVSRSDKPGKPKPPVVTPHAAKSANASYVMPGYGGFPTTVRTCYQEKGGSIICVDNAFPKYSWLLVSNMNGSSYSFWSIGINAQGEGEQSDKTGFIPGVIPTTSPPVKTNGVILQSERKEEEPIWKRAWLLALIAIILLIIIIIIIICLVNRTGGKYGVAKREKDRAGWNSQPVNDYGRSPYDDEMTEPLTEQKIDNRPPPKYPSQNSIGKKPPSDDNDSLGDYEDETNFNEDGSFIGQYGDEKRKSMDLEEKV